MAADWPGMASPRPSGRAVPHGRRSAWLPCPREVAPLGPTLVSLDPDGRAGKVRSFPASRAGALGNQQRAVLWHLDRAGALALVPPRRPAGHGAARHARA
jgi:hypothetical protein